ncbi:MAG: MBL fold metallo-hydrolase, partial [Sediminibacterium sp.]|nr:MBL fold metallo-hydrolase [Sediminibacterium sp.]
VLKNFKIDTINDQTYLLKLLDFNNKVLIYKNQHSLSLFEAPLGYNVCTDIIKICNYYFKGYAIKNLFLSHHHPDHAGGISAFKNLDCNIITTKGNIKYFEKIINNSRYLNKNYSKLSNSNKFKFIIIQNDSNITIDGVRVFEIGRYTTHTKEHLVFLIPEDSLLFVSDLVVFPNGYVHNQSERAYSVYELINRENLEVNKIYTSWPLHGFKNFGTFEDLKSCLLKFIPIYK